jgi:hypothetical protein
MSKESIAVRRENVPAWFPRGLTLLQDPTLNKGYGLHGA